VKESFDTNVPAFQASIPFVSRNHALTRVVISFRRFAPLFSTHSSNLNPGGHFKTILEEAAR